MIAVIFEVDPKPGRKDEYLDIAAGLRPILEATDGFISVERFRSLTDPNKLLSLSFFINEDAILRWRKAEEHRRAQSRGRHDLFSDYRLRVARVVRDYSLHDGNQKPADSKRHHLYDMTYEGNHGVNR